MNIRPLVDQALGSPPDLLTDLLTDEYDKPVLDVLENVEMTTAKQNYLKGVYSIIEGNQEHIHFLICQGISMVRISGKYI
ncbi:MAG: AAA family ATPase [Gammaproteobacteria bacterium]|nr:AAA family ATPase [Gammaproteobacteria bacterium]MCY4227700.1 AAA family ATPase [Gammaproteobacteria bacterium]